MNRNSTTSEHPVVAKAMEAMAAHDARSLAALFADLGSVEDENERHIGARAIRRWFAATPPIEHELLREYAFGPEVELVARAHGDYPQSPLSFRYRFTIDGERIRTLRISLL
ncbi:nuclear transport factor 2 family protein [Agromyces protaetiae]|uniref:Nuclear transport factor 2 family protein n=1 Tax=Agromyces protaetiae TaxID=2509455 RepID=A0A4P6FT54_9MICO|nr:nuclear transport factor 2 family protein [Agromyces protaetiae]QAY73748.1 nuclear transport factor 2 family protein [Agromyces protaetiae]